MDTQTAISNLGHHQVQVLKAIYTLRKARKIFTPEDKNFQCVEGSCLNDIKFHLSQRRKWLRFLIQHTAEWKSAA